MHHKIYCRLFTTVLISIISIPFSVTSVPAEQRPPVQDWLITSDDFRSGFVFGLMTSLRFFAQDDFKNREFVMELALEIRDCAERKGVDAKSAKAAIERYIRDNPKENNSHIYLVSLSALRKLCKA